jgi:solute carrier family 27 (fatty acid transporter), member 1/4
VVVNINGKIGACGFFPVVNPILKILSYYIIKIDEETKKPIRDSKGFCVPCKTDEIGLLIGLIGKSARKQFTGYANNQNESNSKIIEDVFKKGQRAFNSGDLMVRDEAGYVYFKDRLGDTYRWRGENVSTIEVENLISSHLNGSEVVVYGVEIPGEEGRAGMAAMIKNEKINLDELAKYIVDNMAPYARPIFIRFVDDLEHTGLKIVFFFC